MKRPYHLLSANGRAVHHISSDDLHDASMFSHEKHNISSTDTPFISEILDWDPPSDLDLFDLPLDLSIQTNQMEEDGGIVSSDYFQKPSDMAGLDEELITDERPLVSTVWNDLFLDTSSTSASKDIVSVSGTNYATQILKPQVVMKQLSPCVELRPLVRTVSSNSNNTNEKNSNSCTSNSTTATKGRMRWTTELHEAFVEAVNKLGGMENAKPKAVLKHMKVQGLTIYHVKSHLQKYRTARHIPEPSQGSPEMKLTPLEHVTSLDTKRGMYITEALRIQMEVQKQLHEQLEIQRNMQIQIEEQGKTLLMMFEKQNMDFCKTEQEDKARAKTPESFSDCP